MKNALTKKALADFRDMIVQVRGVSVILDSDLAQAYGVTTGALNQAVKRNTERFPSDFMITLTIREAKEIRLLRSQFVILEPKDHPKYPPKAFTEHAITDIIQQIMLLLSPPPQDDPQDPPRPRTHRIHCPRTSRRLPKKETKWLK